MSFNLQLVKVNHRLKGILRAFDKVRYQKPACKTCKHLVNDNKCSRIVTLHPKTRQLVYADADEHREIGGLCGPDGDLYTPLYGQKELSSNSMKNYAQGLLIRWLLLVCTMAIVYYLVNPL